MVGCNNAENGPIHRKLVFELVQSVFCIVGTGSSFAVNQNGKFGGGGQKDLRAGRSGKNEDQGV